jgi:hypothetical protein
MLITVSLKQGPIAGEFNMDSSKFLSKVIGIYLIIISIAMLINMPQFITQVNILIHDSGNMFVTGFFTLILGILMVVSHNLWRWDWRLVITIIAWLTFLKGASIIIYPQFIAKTTILFMQDMNIAFITAGLDLCLGILLTYFGFKR